CPTCSQCGAGTVLCNGSCVSTQCPNGMEFDTASCTCQTVLCGGAGQPCCANSQCNDGLGCVDGICGQCSAFCGSLGCSTPGCCGNQCQTPHSNGLGQSFYDCNPPDTYNIGSASEACHAWVVVNGGSCATVTCGNNAVAVCGQGTSSCACWEYMGPDAGHV